MPFGPTVMLSVFTEKVTAWKTEGGGVQLPSVVHSPKQVLTT